MDDQSEDEDDNPENHMIIEDYEPVLAACHQDGYVRFWNMKVSVHLNTFFRVVFLL